MANKKVDWSSLQQFIPPNTFSFINNLLNEHSIKIVITKPRKHILGYYKPPCSNNTEHTITVNGNLSRYAFFIILIHEIAHLKTFVLYKNTVAGHGIEWKKTYADLLKQTLLLNCYPTDLENIIRKKSSQFSSLRSCTDNDILRILKKYESQHKDSSIYTIENIGIGSNFLYKEKIFYIKEKRRTRFLCIDKKTHQQYLFHGLVDVQKAIE
ncbi:MAG: SprT-like domain-containing protein [Chitinophagaceae bacterium]